MAAYGYAGTILKVDLSSSRVSVHPTEEYAEGFLGGRGLAAKLYWDDVSPGVGALEEGNVLVFAVGPLAGLPALGGSRWQVCGKSPVPTPERFSYANLGGTWGAYMKFAGYDAIVVSGRSEKPVYVFVDEETVQIRDASTLWGRGSIETRGMLKEELGQSVRVAAIGPAGENLVTMATVLADDDASGSGGLGAVMGSKMLKALVVRGSRKGVRIARKERFEELLRQFRALKGNLEYRDVVAGLPLTKKGARTRKAPCYGCLGCFRRTYEAENGRKGKFMCGSAMFYMPRAQSYYGEWNDVPFHATKLCDNYGLDALGVELIIHWLQKCLRAGVLSDENTGIPLSRLGSLEFIDTLVRTIALRDGFGDVLAEGVFKAAEALGPEARGQLTDYVSRYGDAMAYHGPRMCVTTGIFHAMEPRLPMTQLHKATGVLHRWLDWTKGVDGAYLSPAALQAVASRFWGSAEAADLTTIEGKALAARLIQDRQSANECLILCDFHWPIEETEYSENHVGEPALESKVLSAVTGNDVDERELCRLGEKVFNLQRAIHVREGHEGRGADCLPDSWYTSPLRRDMTFPECVVPGPRGEAVSKKGTMVDRAAFDRMKDEYYRLRGWDVSSGLQKQNTLEALGLAFVAEDLAGRGLTAETGRR